MKQLLAVALVLTFVLPAYAEMIDNPEYLMWKDFKPGSTVTHSIVAVTAGNPMNITRTVTLVSVSATEAVVKTVQIVKVGGQEINQPAPDRKIPAKVDVDPAAKKKMDAETKTGKEEITVAGEKFDCTWRTSKVTNAAGTTLGKYWMSTKVPGHQVKLESTTTGAATVKMRMTLKSYSAK